MSYREGTTFTEREGVTQSPLLIRLSTWRSCRKVPLRNFLFLGIRGFCRSFEDVPLVVPRTCVCVHWRLSYYIGMRRILCRRERDFYQTLRGSVAENFTFVRTVLRRNNEFRFEPLRTSKWEDFEVDRERGGDVVLTERWRTGYTRLLESGQENGGRFWVRTDSSFRNIVTSRSFRTVKDWLEVTEWRRLSCQKFSLICAGSWDPSFMILKRLTQKDFSFFSIRNDYLDCISSPVHSRNVLFLHRVWSSTGGDP